MQQSMLKEEIDGKPNLEITTRGRGDSNLQEVYALQRAWGLMCKKSEFKRVLKGGEIKCQQNQTTSVVEVVQELVLEGKNQQ